LIIKLFQGKVFKMKNSIDESNKKKCLGIIFTLFFVFITIIPINIIINPFGFYGGSQKSISILNVN
tara:strand:- start:118 stop:315 length:198 start_codon:yes stop_codon:yes gene_type:complete